jgi:hypothetical protein
MDIEEWKPEPRPLAPPAKPIRKRRRAIYTGLAFAGLLVMTIAVMGRHELAVYVAEHFATPAAPLRSEKDTSTFSTDDMPLTVTIVTAQSGNVARIVPLDLQASAPPPDHPLTPAEHSPTLP